MKVNKSGVELLRSTLGRVGEDAVEVPPGDHVVLRGHVFTLVLAGAGLPRDVERVAPKLNSDTVAIAKRFTARARRMLDEAHANWADEAAARIRTESGGLSILVESGAAQARSDPATHFSPTALRVGERLLIVRRVEPITAIAKAAGVSAGRVTQVLQWFDERGFTEKQGGARGPTARRTLDAGSLLDVWVDAVVEEPRPTALAHASTRDIRRLTEEIESGLERLGVEYRLTGWVGVARSAPFLTATPAVHVYLDTPGFASVARDVSVIGLVPVTEAGTVTLWAAPDVTFTADSDARVVHPARLIADLRRLGGRGADAAEHVKEELFDVL
jgi:hypothetical protein